MCYKPIEIIDKYGRPQKASCRKCIECLQVRANEWGLRAHFELKNHEENCFLTLTYDENPIYLVKLELQRFIKRLRKKIAPKKIKYFSCGEYGDQKLRPHFHIIIFGHDFHDKKFLKNSRSGKPMYYSEELQKIWGYGYCVVQEANIQTVRYSAKYSTKHKKDLPEHLQDFPEFNTMSQGLGIQNLIDKMDIYLQTDEIYIDGFAYQIPDIVLEKYAKKLIPECLEFPDRNGFNISYDYRDWVRDWKKKNRKFKDVSPDELKTRERRAIKRRDHSQLRVL